MAVLRATADLHTLVDLRGLGWPPLEITGSGLTIAATCTLRQLAAFRGPPEWSALPLLDQCCAALAGSFKISQEATGGGNVCLALPAGPMIALAVGLDGVAVVWPEAGGERRMPVAELVTGVRRTTLHAGDVLRAVEIPDSALQARTAPGDDAWAEHEAGQPADCLVRLVDPDRPEQRVAKCPAATIGCARTRMITCWSTHHNRLSDPMQRAQQPSRPQTQRDGIGQPVRLRSGTGGAGPLVICPAQEHTGTECRGGQGREHRRLPCAHRVPLHVVHPRATATHSATRAANPRPVATPHTCSRSSTRRTGSTSHRPQRHAQDTDDRQQRQGDEVEGDQRVEWIVALPAFSRSSTVSGDRAGSHGHHAVSAIMAGRWAIGRIRKRILPKDRSGPAHDRYLSLISVGRSGPELLLQQVPEHNHGKNRLHLDLRTRDLDAEVDRVQQAGATRLTEQPIEESGWRWHVLADAEASAGVGDVHQDHIILPEVGHILADHHSDDTDDEYWRQMMPDLSLEVIRRALRRTHYDTEQEQEAELVATIIMEWASVLDYVSARPSPEPAVWRLQDALGDRQGWL